MAMNNFADRLINAIDEKKNPSVAGIDPAIGNLPPHIVEKYMKESSLNEFEAAAEAVLEFGKGIVDAVSGIVPAVKLQSAYYEQLGPAGVNAFLGTIEYAKANSLIVIADVKRNDIGSTSEAYSNAYLGRVGLPSGKKAVFDADALTVNSYLGYDGMKPFIDDCEKYGKGLFSLVKTSNKGSEEFQLLETDRGPNYVAMARLLSEWGRPLQGESGYSPIGAVVGATFPKEAEVLRKEMKNSLFLVPGYGAQGGDAESIAGCFNSDGCGAIVNSSRGIIFAWKKHNDSINYKRYAAEEALAMRGGITKVLREKGICRW